MKYIDTFVDVIDNYDLFIVDVWGVVHNDGVKTFEGVIDLLQEIQNREKHLHFLSNSPGSAKEVKEALFNIGIEEKYYDDVHTSGEETRLLLTSHELGVGNNCFVIDETRGIIDGTFIKEESNLDNADFVLASGIKSRLDLGVYDNLLTEIKSRNLKMICPNPDIIVKTIEGELFCPGAIAKKYEDLGGDVTYIGKPYSKVYDRIFHKYTFTKDRIIGIGDGPYTDIMGANNFGIDSALVIETGILATKFFISNNIDKKSLGTYLDNIKIHPKYIIKRFF